MAAAQGNRGTAVEDETGLAQPSQRGPEPLLFGWQDLQVGRKAVQRLNWRRGRGGTGPEGASPSFRCQ